jgi:hypothetical protein
MFFWSIAGHGPEDRPATDRRRWLVESKSTVGAWYDRPSGWVHNLPGYTSRIPTLSSTEDRPTGCMADHTRVQSFPVGGCHGSSMLHYFLQKSQPQPDEIPVEAESNRHSVTEALRRLNSSMRYSSSDGFCDLEIRYNYKTNIEGTSNV